MLQVILSVLILGSALVSALPTPSNAPSRTLEAREPAPDSLTDNVFAVAAISNAKTRGYGGGPNKDSSCDLGHAKLPTVSGASPLPSPSGTLSYVAIGRGTQNYTCDASKPSSTPVAAGAVANLYDASCVAGKHGFLMNLMPLITLQFPKPATFSNDDLVSMQLLGHHYFVDSKTPTFDLATSNGDAGYVEVKSGDKAPAPSGAPVGQNGKGYGAVPWLTLPQKSGKAGGQPSFSEVMRLNTAGGQPPSTCEGMPGTFEVEYAAEYWFYR